MLEINKLIANFQHFVKHPCNDMQMQEFWKRVHHIVRGIFLEDKGR